MMRNVWWVRGMTASVALMYSLAPKSWLLFLDYVLSVALISLLTDINTHEISFNFNQSWFTTKLEYKELLFWNRQESITLILQTTRMNDNLQNEPVQHLYVLICFLRRHFKNLTLLILNGCSEMENLYTGGRESWNETGNTVSWLNASANRSSSNLYPRQSCDLCNICSEDFEGI